MLIGLAIGVWIGNWLVVPLFFKDRPFFDGFFIGLLAGIFVLILGHFFPK